MKAVQGVCALKLLLLILWQGAYSQSTAPITTTKTEAGASVPFPGGGDDLYRIGFQDTIEIRIFRRPEMTQVARVNPNGTISLGKLKEPLVAVCKTESELARDVADAYRKDYLRDPQVTVLVTEQRSRAFSVIGAVEKPGSYFINRRVRLLELLAQAGGPSKEAGTRLLVARTGSTSNCKLGEGQNGDKDDVTLMDFRISDVLAAKQNLVMQPGDIVSVLDADFIYLYGHVKKQGQIPIREPITLTQAIASGEGLDSGAKKSNVRILRQKSGSAEREELVFDLREIDSRKVNDPFLEPNDIVAVSEDRVKSILNSIGRSLTTGASTLFYRVP